MKRILFFLLLLISFNSFGQLIQKGTTYGQAFKRGGYDLLMWLPSDTLTPPAAYIDSPFVARKGSTIYLWNTLTHVWASTTVNNIYTSDGTVTGDRIVSGNTNRTLDFNDFLDFNIRTKGLGIESNDGANGVFSIVHNTGGVGSEINNVVSGVTSQVFFGAGSVKLHTENQNIFDAQQDSAVITAENFRIDIPSKGAGRVLTSTANGSATWTTPPTVSGTTNYIPKFTGTSSIGNSDLFNDGGTVRIYNQSELAFYSDAGTTRLGGIDFNTATSFNWRNAAGTLNLRHDFSALSGSDKTATWRNLSGTVAYLSDITSNITVGATTITSGTSTRVPFNDGGVYGEDAGLTYNKTTDALTLAGDLNFSTIYKGLIWSPSNRIISDLTNALFLEGTSSISFTAGGVNIGAFHSGGLNVGSTTAPTTKLQVTGRFASTQGADVASAAGAIALGIDGNSFELTGTAAVTLISNVGWVNGSEVTLLFTSTASLTDGTANSGTDIGMELAGNANFTGSAGATLTLILSEIGGTQRWREKSRSVQ